MSSVTRPRRKTSQPTISTLSEGGRRIGSRLLDARPDRLDLRDLPYRPPLRSLPPRFPEARTIAHYLSSYAQAGLVLDQGTEGACTGFGLACVIDYLLFVRHLESGRRGTFERVSPRMLYEMAKRYDEWQGEDYEGSSCRGALKGWHKHGVCAEAKWPYRLAADGTPVFVRPGDGWDRDAVRRPLGVYYRVQRDSIVDLQSAIVNIGAVYVSGQVHDGWDALATRERRKVPAGHDRLPLIPPPRNPKDVGGHAFAFVGYNERGFVVQNSWGPGWGVGGFAILGYDDWIRNGTDAWACALGVALEASATAARTRLAASSPARVPSGRSLTALERSARNPGNPPDDPWPFDHPFQCAAYLPLDTPRAYEHTLVSGNDGELVVSDFTRSRADRVAYAKEIVYDRPLAWLRAQGTQTLRLAVYAHGGLNAESESVQRIRVLAPYFLANGVYPLFLTWKTGAAETLCDLTRDWARKLFGAEAARAAGLGDVLAESRDRAVEATARVLGRGVWTEMRENAALGQVAGRGLDLAARNAAALATALRGEGKRLEVHLIGHSAGSILLGHLLTRLGQADLAGAAPKVKTCTLFAAACSTRFAVEHYLPAAAAGRIDLRKLWLYFLSDRNERADGLPDPDLPAYGKSLLYLVSRALDDARKMPLLGMERALDPAFARDDDQWAREELASVQAWQAAWNGVGTGVKVADASVRNTRENGQVPATHGSFDNNIAALTETLERVAGKRLVAPLEWLDY